MSGKKRTITYEDEDDDFDDMLSKKPESEAEDVMNDDNDDEYDLDESEDEEDIDEELDLSAEVAATIKNLTEKKELLAFKRSHSEVEWEEKLHDRMEQIGRKMDFERLKRMTKPNDSKPSQSSSKKQQSKASAKDKKVGKEKNNNEEVLLNESLTKNDSDYEYNDRNEDDDDDLFDSDEEAEISKRYVSKTTTTKTQSISNNKKTSKNDDDDSDDEIIGHSNQSKSYHNQSIEDDEFHDDDSNDETNNNKKHKLTNVRKTSQLSVKKKQTTNNLLTNESSDDDDDSISIEDGEIHETKRKRSNNVTTISNPIQSTTMGVNEDNEGNYEVKKQRKSMISDYETNEVDSSEVATVDDYHTIQIRRHIFIKWLYEPYFKEAVVGAFVRFLIGFDKNTRTNVFRMARIESVEEDGTIYSIKTTVGKAGLGGVIPTKVLFTNYRFTVSVGHNTRKGIKITDISDQRIEPREFAVYCKLISDNNNNRSYGEYKLLTKNQVQSVRNKIQNALKHVYTDQEIKDMVKRKQGWNKSLSTEYHHAMTSLQNNLQRAIDANETIKVIEIERTMKKLEEEIKMQKELFDKATSKLTSLNKRNREGNFRKDVEAGVKKRMEEAKGNIVTAAKNPYLRRETKATILWNTGKKLKQMKAELDNKSISTNPNESNVPGISGDKTVIVPLINNDKIQKEVKLNDNQSIDDEFYDINKDDMNTIRICGRTIDEARSRVMSRHGVDPIAMASKSIQERYLEKFIHVLPPKESKEREQLRNGISIHVYLQNIRK